MKNSMAARRYTGGFDDLCIFGGLSLFLVIFGIDRTEQDVLSFKLQNTYLPSWNDGSTHSLSAPTERLFSFVVKRASPPQPCSRLHHIG